MNKRIIVETKDGFTILTGVCLLECRDILVTYNDGYITIWEEFEPSDGSSKVWSVKENIKVPIIPEFPGTMGENFKKIVTNKYDKYVKEDFDWPILYINDNNFILPAIKFYSTEIFRFEYRDKTDLIKEIQVLYTGTRISVWEVEKVSNFFAKDRDTSDIPLHLRELKVLCECKVPDLDKKFDIRHKKVISRILPLKEIPEDYIKDILVKNQINNIKTYLGDCKEYIEDPVRDIIKDSKEFNEYLKLENILKNEIKNSKENPNG